MTKNSIKKTIALLVSLISILLIGCAQPAPDEIIDLTALEPLAENRSDDVLPLRVAVAAVISPQGTAESYSKLLEYLSDGLGRPVELVQRRTYAEVNDLLQNGEIDLAFVCTSAYIVGHDEFGMELLVVPQVNGETVYYSTLIVPATSSAKSMEDLRGTVFAFTDPMSNTGRMYPTSLVLKLGSTPEQFFSSTFYTYSHDDAIRAIAEGVADGAAVDNLVLEFALARDPDLSDEINIIQRSPPFGIPPVVVSPEIRPQLRANLENLLIGMENTSEGREALSMLDYDAFVLIEDSAYDSVRVLFDEITPLMANYQP